MNNSKKHLSSWRTILVTDGHGKIENVFWLNSDGSLAGNRIPRAPRRHFDHAQGIPTPVQKPRVAKMIPKTATTDNHARQPLPIPQITPITTTLEARPRREHPRVPPKLKHKAYAITTDDLKEYK